MSSELCVVVRWRPDGTITWASPSAESMLGFTPDQMLAMRAGDLADLGCLPLASSCEERLTPQHPRCSTEAPLTLPDGSVRWLRRESCGFFTDAVLTAIQTVGVDITETRLALDEAEASEHRLANVLEHLEDAILLCTADGRVSWVCPSIRRMFGDVDLETIGSDVRRLLEPDDRALTLQAFREVVAEGPMAQRRLLITVRHTDWPDRRIDILQVNMLHVRGVNAIVMHASDVTVRERAARVEFETHLRELLVDVREFVLHLDDTGVVHYASPHFEERFGRGAIGRPLVESLNEAVTDTEERSVIENLLAETRDSANRRIMGRVQLRCDADRTWWVELTCRRVADEATLSGVIVAGRILDESTDPHLAIVTGAVPGPSLTADDLVAAFRRLGPTEKLAVISEFRSTSTQT